MNGCPVSRLETWAGLREEEEREKANKFNYVPPGDCSMTVYDESLDNGDYCAAADEFAVVVWPMDRFSCA